MNQQQFEQMIRQMQGGGQEGYTLKREPTVEEIDLFIERCVKEKGYTEHTLYQAILFKLERGVHSPVEGVVLPVDLVLTDLPYGTTKAKWDSCVDLEEMWEWLESCTNENTPICLFSQTPFDKVLGVSNIKHLRYEWIWEKVSATGHLNAKKMPMKAHENILTFYKKLPLYHPQKTSGHVLKQAVKQKDVADNCELYGKNTQTVTYSSTDRYPRDILRFSSDKQKLALHSTQKPLDLLRYMIRTYTEVGDTVLDFTAGSFSTGVAAYLEGRNSILVEKDKYQFAKSLNWLKCCNIEDPYNIT